MSRYRILSTLFLGCGVNLSACASTDGVELLSSGEEGHEVLPSTGGEGEVSKVAQAITYGGAAANWGLLDNNQYVRGTYFYAGDMTPGADGAYFTLHAKNPSVDYAWSSHAAQILQQIADTGGNVVVAPYFGFNFCSPRFADVQPPSYDKLFDTAINGHSVFILPALEDSWTCLNTTVTPSKCDASTNCTTYAVNSDVNTPYTYVGDPVTHWGLLTVRRLVSMLEVYVSQPRTRAWARIYGRDGVARYAVSIGDMGNQPDPAVTPQDEVARLEDIAIQVQASTGFPITFTVDLFCVNSTPCAMADISLAQQYAQAFAGSQHIAAIENFGTEISSFARIAEPAADSIHWPSQVIHLDDTVHFPGLLAATAQDKRSYLKTFAASLPTYADVSPGYNTPPFWYPAPPCTDFNKPCKRGTIIGDEGDDWTLVDPLRSA